MCKLENSKPRIMITQSLFTCSSLLILSLHLLQQISAADSYCTPSACGVIPNISSPFRLKDDPPHCGDPSYELVCENNVTSVYLSSHKYHVREINYHNFTIGLVDTSMNSSSICPIPKSSQIFNSSDSFSLFFPYYLDTYKDKSFITFMTYPDLLNRSSLLIQLPDCKISLNSSGGRHNSYAAVGRRMNHVYERYTCTTDFLVPISWNFSDLNNVSLSEIHLSLLYGFEVSWFRYMCRHCKEGYSCYIGLDRQIVCGYHSYLYFKWEHIMDSFRSPDGPSLGCLMIFLLLVVILFVGVSLSAKIIIGFGGLYWLIIVKNWYIEDIKRIIVLSFEVRFIVGFICAMGFLIYTFRRRHLSIYQAIEGFLQSDNKLAPIRYSYSDLKKITRRFREKLGEGGFGSVYKGKLRSGHDVAVKLLRNPRENSQDFMNEIATIGRIHHSTYFTLTLLVYCAQSTRDNSAGTEGVYFIFTQITTTF